MMMPLVLKFTGNNDIKGESILPSYEDQIDVFHVDHKILLPMLADKTSQSSTRTTGRAMLGGMVCYMRMNRSITKFLQAAAQGLNCGQAVLTMVKTEENKQKPVLDYALEETYVEAVELLTAEELATFSQAYQGVVDASTRAFKVKLNYTKFKATYHTPDGKAETSSLTGMGA